MDNVLIVFEHRSDLKFSYLNDDETGEHDSLKYISQYTLILLSYFIIVLIYLYKILLVLIY